MAESTGAASALKWMSEREVSARQVVEKADKALELALHNAAHPPPSRDGEDFEDGVRDARRQRDDAYDAWQKLAVLLQKFDRSVPDSKRDVSEGLKKGEVEKLAFHLGITFRTGVMNLITELSGRVLECKNPVEVHRMIEPKMAECMTGAIESAKREGHIPHWLADKFNEVF